ncbi:MAG: hypothetical protein J5620_00560 [Alphaproteobacteria bacterium]|nr:hypothetical protein [Alphaproteobacteria bacterium]
MRISILSIGAIASVLSINAYATSSTVTSRGYVDAQDALKQDLINADTMEFSAYGDDFEIPTVVSYDTTNGLVGDEYGIVNNEIAGIVSDGDGLWGFSDSVEVLSTTITDKMIPTVRAVANETRLIWDNMNNYLQNRIPKSGYGEINGSGVTNAYTEGSGGSTFDYLNIRVKGTGIATRTGMDNVVGERKIIEESDVPNYQASNLTANQKAIQKISIPTMGAVMAAISNNQVTLPTGTAGNVVTYNSNGVVGGSVATYTGAAAYNATNDSAKIPTMAGVTTYAQAKMTCAGWPDGTTTYDATHTDANCWLWNKN